MSNWRKATVLAALFLLLFSAASAEEDGRICAVCAAMPTGTGFATFARRWPQRFFDVMDAAAETEGIASVTYDREGLAFLAFACENEPVSSANVRKAIDRLVDVDALCQGYLKGHGAPVYGYYGNGQWMVEKAGQEAIDALNLYPYDVDEAIALLEADGWTLEDGASLRTKDGQELTINWVRPEISEVADLLESMLTENFAKAGIGLTVTKMSYEDLSAAYYRQTDRSEYDMFFLGSNFGMTFNAYPAVSTEAAYQGAWNTTAIADAELEALALDMNRTKPGETKAYTEKWLAFQTRWVEDLPMAPLCAGGVCYCLLHAGLGVAAGGGLTVSRSVPEILPCSSDRLRRCRPLKKPFPGASGRSPR